MARHSVVLWGIESSFASELVETIEGLNLELVAGVILDEPMWNLRGVPVVLHLKDITARLTAHPAAIAYITPAKRRNLMDKIAVLGVQRYAHLIDLRAHQSHTALTEQGLYMAAGSIMGPGVSCGKGVTLNRASSVGHHTNLGDFVSVGPGATIASHCVIGVGSFVGAGATIGPGIRVGANSTVGAGAVVLRDVVENVVVMGNPARIARDLRKTNILERGLADQA